MKLPEDMPKITYTILVYEGRTIVPQEIEGFKLTETLGCHYKKEFLDDFSYVIDHLPSGHALFNQLRFRPLTFVYTFALLAERAFPFLSLPDVRKHISRSSEYSKQGKLLIYITHTAIAEGHTILTPELFKQYLSQAKLKGIYE